MIAAITTTAKTRIGGSPRRSPRCWPAGVGGGRAPHWPSGLLRAHQYSACLYFRRSGSRVEDGGGGACRYSIGGGEIGATGRLVQTGHHGPIWMIHTTSTNIRTSFFWLGPIAEALEPLG